MSSRRIPNTLTNDQAGTALLDELAEIVAGLLRDRIGLDADTATAVGEEAAVKLSEHWGGGLVYVPVGRMAKVLAMHQAIWERAKKGESPEQLRRSFGVSLQWVYAIIRRMRKAEIDAKQPDIFT